MKPTPALPISLSEILFLDIETISQRRYLSFVNGNQVDDSLFKKRFDWLYQREGKQWDEIWSDQAPLTAEFGRILSISIGTLRATKTNGDVFYVKTFIDRDEKKVLKAFNDSVEVGDYKAMVAHNGHEFDFPFIHRRCLINDIAPLPILNPFGKKPWTLGEQLLDTLKIWSGLQYNHRISLDLLADIFGIPSPKTEMKGSEINEMYHGMFDQSEGLPFDKEEQIFNKIARYNQGDVKTLVNVFCRMMGQPMINELQMSIL